MNPNKNRASSGCGIARIFVNIYIFFVSSKVPSSAEFSVIGHGDKIPRSRTVRLKRHGRPVSFGVSFEQHPLVAEFRRSAAASLSPGGLFCIQGDRPPVRGIGSSRAYFQTPQRIVRVFDLIFFSDAVPPPRSPSLAPPACQGGRRSRDARGRV